MSCEQPPRGRLARPFEAADRRRVPLRTILVTVGVVVAAYLAGKLMYLLRDIVPLMLVAGFARAARPAGNQHAGRSHSSSASRTGTARAAA